MGFSLVEMAFGLAAAVATVLGLVQRRRVYGGVRLSFDRRFAVERRRMSRSRWWDRQVRLAHSVTIRRAARRVRRAQRRYEERRDDAILGATRRCSPGPGRPVARFGRLELTEHTVAVGRTRLPLSGARATVALHPRGWEVRVGPEPGPFAAVVLAERDDAERAAETVNAQAFDHDRYRTDHPRLLHTAQVMAVEAVDRSELDWAEARLTVVLESGHLAVERVVARTERALARDAYIDALRRHALAEPLPAMPLRGGALHLRHRRRRRRHDVSVPTAAR